ncbi:acyltransferase [bacterium]|nr:acyltransferase [bacterium]
MLTISSELSKRITVMRVVLLVLVIFVHNSVSVINFSSGTVSYAVPLFIDKIRILFTSIFGNIAVPMFFFLSGLLHFTKKRSYWLTLKKKVKTLLIPYLLWNFLLIVFYLIGQHLPFSQGLFGNAMNDFSRFTWIDWLDCFVGKFTVRAPYPILVPMWFIRDLMIVNLLYPIIEKLIDKLPLSSLLVMLFLWLMGIDLTIVSPVALLFFSLGYYVVKHPNWLKVIDRVNCVDILPIYVLGCILQLAGYYQWPLSSSCNLFLGCLIVFKLSLPLVKSAKTVANFTFLNQYNFWIFALHSTVLAILQKLYVKFLPVNGYYMLLEYFLLVAVTIIICLISGIVCKKMLPRIFKILTGGR